MHKKNKFLIGAIIATVIFILFWIRPTRAIMMWLLPLGRGTDDVIVLIAMVVGGVFWLFAYFYKKIGGNR